MNAKKLLIALVAAAVLVPAGAYAQSVYLFPDAPAEHIVEGHTTWAEIQKVNETPYAALAVYVEERIDEQVLWFDDSFIHYANEAKAVCRGGVWATNEGVPLTDLGTPFRDYYVDDPFGNTFITVEYNVDPLNLNPVTRHWGVSVLKTPYGAGDGCYEIQTVTHNPDSSDLTASVNHTTYDIRYNALLWFDLDRGPITTDTPREYGNDGSGAGADGLNDQDRTEDGNSHAFNPNYPTTGGDADHGDIHQHGAFLVDLYFLEEEPTLSGNKVFDNLETWAYHTH